MSVSQVKLYGSEDGVVKPHEVEHFKKLSDVWWDPLGTIKILHNLNHIRVPYVLEGLRKTHPYKFTNDKKKPLSNFTILEIGCGGGILTEGLARLGCKVVGVDAGEDLINLSKEHAKLDSELDGLITYVHSTIEGYSKTNKECFDAIVISEVIEHIPEKEPFLKSCISTLKPEGSVFITTFNRSFMAWFCGVFLAENVFNCIPKNTHDYNLFISPEGVEEIAKKYNCDKVDVKGINYIPWKGQWYYTWHRQISYVMQLIKNVPWWKSTTILLEYLALPLRFPWPSTRSKPVVITQDAVKEPSTLAIFK